MNPSGLYSAAGTDIVLVGCAGWSLRVEEQPGFPGAGTHLARYAGRFPAVEINTSFYRPHRPSTSARWAASVPDGFRFSAKLPKEVTHRRKLVDADEPLDRFLAEVGSLGSKLGCLLVQLPPSLAWEAGVSDRFLRGLRERHAGPVAVEPRHASWFAPDPEAVLKELGVARVAADPVLHPGAGEPAGDGRTVYYRLHGSPRTYYSSYDSAYLDALAARLRDAARRADHVWCVFDNTALGAAVPNALDLISRLA